MTRIAVPASDARTAPRRPVTRVAAPRLQPRAAERREGPPIHRADEQVGPTRRRGWLVRRALVTADVVCLTVAFLTMHWALGGDTGGRLAGAGELLVFVAALPGWVVAAKLSGLYDRDEEHADHSTAEELVGVLQTISVGVWAFVATAQLTGLAETNLARMTLFWALAVGLVTTGRGAARALARRHDAYVQRTLVVGAGAVGATIARKIDAHPEYGLELVGFVDGDPVASEHERGSLPVLGGLDELPRLVHELRVERVVFAFSADGHDAALGAMRAVRDLDVQVDVVPRLFEMVGATAQLHALEGLPLVSVRPARLTRFDQLLKRAIDVVVSAVALVVLGPFFALAALVIRLDSPGPVFFRQLRMGSDERPFRILKFRTMVADAEARRDDVAALNIYAEAGDARMFKAHDDPRVTRVGRLLRRTSLDELPQLLNVLRGQMSLVGPRPLVLDEDRHVAGWGRRRLNLRPGITGPWQALGRNAIPFDEMIRLDYHYATNWSLRTDLALLFRTIPAVVRARRAY